MASKTLSGWSGWLPLRRRNTMPGLLIRQMF